MAGDLVRDSAAATGSASELYGRAGAGLAQAWPEAGAEGMPAVVSPDQIWAHVVLDHQARLELSADGSACAVEIRADSGWESHGIVLKFDSGTRLVNVDAA